MKSQKNKSRINPSSSNHDTSSIPENTENIRSERKSSGDRRKKTIVDYLLIGIAAVCLIVGVILLLIDPIKNMKRQAVTDEIMADIAAGESTFIVDRNENQVNGEDYDYFYGTEEEREQQSIAMESEMAELPDDVVLTALGTIKISSADINIPLLDEATVIALRYGAGRLEGTANPGEYGNMVILGHRMRASGKLFNRLGEVKIGDTIEITAIDGTVYVYTVDQIIDALEPEALVDYIDISDGSGKQVTLVTCTPTGVATHRLLVIGHMAEEE